MPDSEIPLNVPNIGDAERIELVSWNVAAGNDVARGQELCELVTDKAAFPLESPFAGRLARILVDAGKTVVVGETLAVLERADQD
jgi:pyruvate/2-oxoglutarate dehydrogenase complex dihydrolipoamide acyltransferase (E2) component